MGRVRADRRHGGHAQPARRLPRGEPPRTSMHGGSGRPAPATRATASPGRGRTTARTTTAPSCGTRAATAPRPCTSRRRAAPAGSTISGFVRAMLRPSAASGRRSRRSSGSALKHDTPDWIQYVGADATFSYVEGEPTENVHLAFPAAGRRDGRGFHAAAVGAGFTDNGPPGRAAALPPGLRRRLRARPRRQQHRSGLPQPLS